MEQYIRPRELVHNKILGQDEHVMRSNKLAWRICCEPRVDADFRFAAVGEAFFALCVFKAESATRVNNNSGHLRERCR